jgi:prepilin-type N-terminal cleavage/methylation domain-containing protein
MIVVDIVRRIRAGLEVPGMKNQLQRCFNDENGFTLIELITVIVLLGVILGIGVPRYAIMQAQSEWDADVITLKNFAKAAELYYARLENPGTPIIDENGKRFYKIMINDLHNAGLFDNTTVLNRTVGENYKSVRNATSTPLERCDDEGEAYIWINADTGEADYVDNNNDGVNDQFAYFIGLKPPYDVTHYGDMGLDPWAEDEGD